jgi:hypothetical protein
MQRVEETLDHTTGELIVTTKSFVIESKNKEASLLLSNRKTRKSSFLRFFLG